MESRSQRAVAAAVALARAHGLPPGDPVVLRDLTNVIVHLRPAPVVARVPIVFARRGRDAIAQQVEIARFLAARGAPVTPPAEEVDAGPHEQDGFLVSFWRFLEHERYVDDPAALGRSMRDLHTALAEYQGDLPSYFNRDELRGLVAGLEPSTFATREELDGLGRLVERLPEPLGGQAVHGDAHLGNVLWTSAGPLWGDLENVCNGPVEYDLASISYRKPGGLAALLQAYGPYDEGELSRVEPALAVMLAGWTLRLAADARLPKNPEPRVRVERALAYAREI